MESSSPEAPQIQNQEKSVEEVTSVTAAETTDLEREQPEDETVEKKNTTSIKRCENLSVRALLKSIGECYVKRSARMRSNNIQPVPGQLPTKYSFLNVSEKGPDPSQNQGNKPNSTNPMFLGAYPSFGTYNITLRSAPRCYQYKGDN
ncbi:uncharacterized protein LOC110675359 isoform X2 [Aedes aegypti]|uniref:Uncharacterized protein n=1 Tax=Aedes aegypti TaxID=7159 RepID=A0A6I8TYW1_AEDAE|nr:uncharacterized protein LOC110675359 isoform X2 [Aedes aegypti]